MTNSKAKRCNKGLAVVFTVSALALLLTVSISETGGSVEAALSKFILKSNVQKAPTRRAPARKSTDKSAAPARVEFQKQNQQGGSETPELGYHGSQQYARTTCDCVCRRQGTEDFLCPVSIRYSDQWAICDASKTYSVEASPETDCSVLHGVSCYGSHPTVELGLSPYGELESCDKVVKAWHMDRE